MRGSAALPGRIAIAVGLIAMAVLWAIGGSARADSLGEPLPVLHLHPAHGPVGTLVTFDAVLTPREVRFFGARRLSEPLLVAGNYPVSHDTSCDLVLATTDNRVWLDRSTGKLRGQFRIGRFTSCSQSRGAARPVPTTGFGVQFPCVTCNVAVFRVTAKQGALPFTGFPTTQLLIVAAMAMAAGAALTTLAQPRATTLRVGGRHRAGPRHRR